jgi:multiple sugar transport system ATP-binding protein
MGDRVAVMRDGRLEQVDSPQRLYEQPANMFVAGFIGSPAMNMLAGRIEPEAGRFLTGDGVALPIGQRPTATPQDGAVYGLRPESFRLGGDIPLKVEVVEPTGSETHVLGRLGGTEVVGVFRERIGAGPGEEIHVSVDPAATHLFDAATGMRLSA